MTSQLSNLTTEPDDLFADIPGEVILPGDTDKDAPETLHSYWDSPYIVLTSNNGMWSWQCHHCGSTYRGKNASKAGKHLTGLGSQHIIVCKGAMSPTWRSLYRDLAQRMAEKRAATSNTVGQFQRLQSRHDAASLKSVQKDKEARLQASKNHQGGSVTSHQFSHQSSHQSVASSHCNSRNSSGGPMQLIRRPAAGVRSSTTLDSWMQANTKSKPPPLGQMTLSAGLPNPTGNEVARNAVARYLICTNKPLGDCDDLLFQTMCLSFRNVDSKFQFPCRRTLTEQYLPSHAKSRREDSYHKLKANAMDFGVAIFGDGATIKRLPLVNLLASSGTCPSALLEIVDCTKHMSQGGIKSAEYIAGLMEPHVEKLGRDYVDLFLFDGGSNVQKAGKLMAIHHPRTTCVHAAEHLISLFLGDICKLEPVQQLMKFYRLVYSYLGGSRHKLHAVFKKHTRASNQVSDSSLILFKLCQLRMGGIFYCFLRMCRVKQPMLDTLGCTEAIDANVPLGMKRILQDDDFWKAVVALLRFVAPVLHLLRLSDRKEPGMDKLKYFSRRMVQYMIDNAVDINTIFGCTSELHPNYPTSIWRKLDDYLASSTAREATPDPDSKPTKQTADHSDSDDDTVDTVDSDSDGDSVGTLDEEEALEVPRVPSQLQDTFVAEVLGAWHKRRPYLEHSYAVAGWFMSPAEPIMVDVQTHHSPGDRRTVEDLIYKLLLKPQLTEEATRRAKLDLTLTFWREWREFQTKQEYFCLEMLGWDDPQRETAPHIWHQVWTLPYTKVLGKVACIICSKLCGQGQAEREWGFTKDVRQGKRLRLGSQNLMDQVTCYAAYSVERGLAKAAKKQSLQLVVTDDDYRSLGLDGLMVDLAKVTGQHHEERIVKGFVEDWEKDALEEKSINNEVLLRRKYGGLCYYNTDDGGFVKRTIDPNQVRFSRRKDDIGCYVTGITPTGEEEQWKINEDLHFMILAFMRHNPGHNNVKLVTWNEYMGIGKPSWDDELVDEWISNGGKLAKKPAARKPRKTNSKRKAPPPKTTKSSSKSLASQTFHSCAQADSDSDSSSDAQSKRRRTSSKVVDGGTIEDDSSDSDSDDDTTVGE